MSDETIETHSIEYYYVTWTACGLMTGTAIVKQKKTVGHEPGDFNIAGGHRFLLKQMEFPVIITDWKLVTKQRADELFKFGRGLARELGLTDEKKSATVTHLRVVKDPEKKEEPAPAPAMPPGPFAKPETPTEPTL